MWAEFAGRGAGAGGVCRAQRPADLRRRRPCPAVARELSAAFERIGTGDCPSWLPVHGPSELTRLANGFNLMTHRLASVAAQNHRLNERLLTLQAEERADLARDLHDEIGPSAVRRRHDRRGRSTSARQSTARPTFRRMPAPFTMRSVGCSGMSAQFSDACGRSRPLGLEAAIDRLAAFWRSRRPDIAFDVTVSVEEERIDSRSQGDDISRGPGRPEQRDPARQPGSASRSPLCPASRWDFHVAVADDGIGMAATTRRPSERSGWA